ncbi:FeoA family protein [Bittarella massiliensis (ex Durand et al. 2017)]|uniref:FeoA family protein n=1 Tax=Bittarella massiliensis (ex Durand et al. 2017) TaxID=1720313 RepID=UPI001AA1AFFD|nr:FeoA family protein [Bittarella massiliensis (ex Durand et al. 2017)]MBO1679432.1 ferrous iron transport protein A [Bittarella massiliensis (ex Durand et al. 2017)]
MTLDKVTPGQGGVITQVGGEGVLRRRLLDMGLTPGTRVSVRKIAPMGDPIELFLRSYVLTIRKEEAANIALEGVGDAALPRAAEHRPEPAEAAPGHRGGRPEKHRRGRWGR